MDDRSLLYTPCLTQVFFMSTVSFHSNSIHHKPAFLFRCSSQYSIEVLQEISVECLLPISMQANCHGSRIDKINHHLASLPRLVTPVLVPKTCLKFHGTILV